MYRVGEPQHSFPSFNSFSFEKFLSHNQPPATDNDNALFVLFVPSLDPLFKIKKLGVCFRRGTVLAFWLVKVCVCPILLSTLEPVVFCARSVFISITRFNFVIDFNLYIFEKSDYVAFNLWFTKICLVCFKKLYGNLWSQCYPCLSIFILVLDFIHASLKFLPFNSFPDITSAAFKHLMLQDVPASPY